MNKRTRAIDEETYKLIIATMKSGFTHEGVKYKPNERIATVLVLEYNLGLRVGDILSLCVDSFVKDGSRYRLDIYEQKTGKYRNFTVSDEVYQFVRDYAYAHNISSKAKLFPITERAVLKHLKAVCSYLGLEGVGSHSFRKGFATNVYVNNHYNIELVRTLLQHSSVNVTQRYIGIGSKDKPSEFTKLITKCKKYGTDGKQIVFALENSYGYGRALAAWLIERGYLVKDVNPALSYAYRKSVPQYKKNDSYDAQCVARVAINELNTLPDSMPEDMYWTLSQLVNRRANLKTHHIRLKNQLHEQVCVAYPSYKQFFQDIGRPTALYFWEHYPSPRLLRGKTVEELAEELIPVSHNQFSTRKCQKILDAIKADGDTTRDYQTERDEITRGLVKDVRHYVTQLEEVDKAIADFLPRFECTLNTIPGVSDTTVAKLLSEIGDIRRFPNADKLANFAGIAPVNFSSAGKGDDKPSKQGNRRLQGTIYFLAIQMIQLSSKGLPRNPAFYAYYQRQLARGKTKPQALILISRRLISIIYGMLKNKTEYVMPKVQDNWD